MTEGQKDPEAEALIRRATAERHGAPYYLVQTVLIQDLSLHSAENRITDLETQLTEIKSTSPGAPSFLGAPTAPLAPDSGLAGGNGFLRSAAMTAAGIVGGALVFEGIQSMFGQHDAATITGNQAALPGLGKTFFSKRYGAETDASAAGSTSDHKYGISRVQSDGQVR